jgi:hypothetical protein
MDELPIIFSSHRIEITLAQEALVIGIQQLVDRGWIPAVLPEIQSNCMSILHPPVCGFEFFLAAQVGGDSRCCNCQSQQDENQQEEHGQENETVLSSKCVVSSWGFATT